MDRADGEREHEGKCATDTVWRRRVDCSRKLIMPAPTIVTSPMHNAAVADGDEHAGVRGYAWSSPLVSNAIQAVERR